MFIEAWDGQTGSPIRLSVSQLVVYNNQGTPIMVAAEFGGERSQCVAKAGDAEFERVLTAVGFGHHKVIVDEVSIPPAPPGAKLFIP